MIESIKNSWETFRQSISKNVAQDDPNYDSVAFKNAALFPFTADRSSERHFLAFALYK